MGDADILLVEDNYGDVNLIERAFEDRSLDGEVHAVQTGEEALDWFHGRGEYADVPRPDVVLLDLNLPATNGHAILEEVKSDPDLRRIPVIVLTGSKSEADVRRVYDAGANAYLVKPVGPEEFADLVQLIVEFWVSATTLPPTPESIDGE